jgi:hypothetical protein
MVKPVITSTSASVTAAPKDTYLEAQTAVVGSVLPSRKRSKWFWLWVQTHHSRRYKQAVCMKWKRHQILFTARMTTLEIIQFRLQILYLKYARGSVVRGEDILKRATFASGWVCSSTSLKINAIV